MLGKVQDAREAALLSPGPEPARAKSMPGLNQISEEAETRNGILKFKHDIFTFKCTATQHTKMAFHKNQTNYKIKQIDMKRLGF